MKVFLFSIIAVIFTVSMLPAETKEDSGQPNVLKDLESPKASPSSTGSTTGQVAKEQAPVTNTVSKTEAPPPSVPTTATNLVTASGETAVNTTRTPPKPIDLKGKIERIDAAEGTLSVDGKSFKFSPKGYVYVDNVRKSLADLRVGDLVAVTYWEKADGTLKATYLVKGYPRKKKKKISPPTQPPGN